jgi:hypothetical protein
MRWLVLLLVAGLAACDGETTDLPGAPLGWGPASGTLYSPSGAGIAGDWFICTDENCTAFTSNGLRFENDGTWVALWAYTGQGGYVPGQGYCVSDYGDTYTWDGATLTISGLAEVGDLSCRVTFDGDVAALACLQDYRTYLKRVSGEQVEPCPIYEDVPTGG